MDYVLFTYEAGTSTKQATYTDPSGDTENANPLTLDANGRAQVYGNPGLSYKLVIAPPNSPDPPTSIVWSTDNYQFPPALGTPISGWGTPTGGAVQNDYSGSAATLAETSAAVAEIITALQQLGLFTT